jgi:hypothetical protein
LCPFIVAHEGLNYLELRNTYSYRETTEKPDKLLTVDCGLLILDFCLSWPGQKKRSGSEGVTKKREGRQLNSLAILRVLYRLIVYYERVRNSIFRNLILELSSRMRLRGKSFHFQS